MINRIKLLLFIGLAFWGCKGSYDEDEKYGDLEGGTALEHAYLVEAELGPIPTFNCDDGVLIPIYQNGVEIFEDLPNGACDYPDLKGDCLVGSRIGRIQGTYEDGSTRPDVVWVFFCRRGDDFAQMIGHNTTTGKTTFLELNDGYLPTNEYLQPNVYVPTPNDENYDNAWKAPAHVAFQSCNSCHNSDPFIHSRWVVGAKMPDNPDEPVLPEVATPNSPYCMIGDEFQSWELKHINIPNNACLGCHRLGNLNAWQFITDTDWNLYMPPHNPGSLSDDYDEIKDWLQSVEQYKADEIPEDVEYYDDVPPCR